MESRSNSHGVSGNNIFFPASPDSHLSDVSFPSHVSGFESFIDMEETMNATQVEDGGNEERDGRLENFSDTFSNPLPHVAESNMMNEFLKVSSPPTSLSHSNSLDESSMSLTKLEVIQANMQDSFLNSHSEDSEKELKIMKFLEQSHLLSSDTNNKTPSLSDAIDLSKKRLLRLQSTESSKTAPDDFKGLNQTELDSIFVKEVRQRLQISSMESTKYLSGEEHSVDFLIDKSPSSSSSNHDIDETLRHIDEQIQITDGSRNSDSVKILKEVGGSAGDGVNRGCMENIRRPNVDGSSSGSDNDVQTTAATNFARSGLGTARVGFERYSLEEQLEELNINEFPERQLAEGGDNISDVFNDGGGGGDGSSGHSDSDNGGDGGVAIRNVARIAPGIRHNQNSNDLQADDADDDHIAMLNRERPVGESATANGTVRTRQVQFTISTSSANSNTPVSTRQDPSKVSNENDSTPSNQESRLSSRFFLAASTPFRPGDQTVTDNWLSPSSFHVSQSHDKTEERTLVGEDISFTGPYTSKFSFPSTVPGDGPSWMPVSHMEKVKTSLPGTDGNKASVEDFLHSMKKPYNPFETLDDTNSFADYMGFDDNNSVKSEDFQTAKDLEGMFLEDEKMVAMNNNSVYKTGDETVISEWSMHSENQRINSNLVANTDSTNSTDDGRVSVYFKSKSHELGQLSGENGPRPCFSDDSHEVVTPPMAAPLPLIREVATAEQTIPLNISNQTFDVTTPVQNECSDGKISTTSETPKSSLLTTHKRQSATVMKKSNRQVLDSKDCGNVKKNLTTSNGRQNSIENDNKGNKDAAFAGNITIPVSEEEADVLLTDIKDGRVSTIGMNDKQMLELAKCISSMTGTDISIVYKLISLLPGTLNNSNGLGDHLTVTPDQSVDNIDRKSSSISSISSTTCESGVNKSIKSNDELTRSCTPTNYDNCSVKYVRSPTRAQGNQLNFAAAPPNKPISSVIPLNKHNDVNENKYLADCQNDVESSEFYVRSHSGGNNYLQSTRLLDRFSDPNPQSKSHFFPKQQLASGISPVYKDNHFHIDYTSSSGTYKHPVVRDCFRKEPSCFQPLQSLDSSEDKPSIFHPLSHVSRSISQPELCYNNLRTSQEHSSIFSSNHMSSGYYNAATDSFLQYVNSISFPNYVSFDVCCVDTTNVRLIQIHNSNSVWMQCKLHVVFSAFNGRETNTRAMDMFIFPPKLTLEPHSTEDVKIKFQAKQSGNYMVKIEILVARLVTENVSIKWHRLPTLLNLEGAVELPDIELLLNEKSLIDFGEIAYGSHTSTELKILNKGRADVPVTLCIAQGSYACQFFKFENTEVDVNTSNNCYSTQRCSLLIKGRGNFVGVPIKPTCVPLRFEAPLQNVKDQLQPHSICRPEELNCQLDIETQTSHPIPISSVLMKACVGISRLHSLRMMQAISLTCTEGEVTTRTIPLKNAGSITLNLEAKIVGSASHFDVHPCVVSLKPGMESELTISFKSVTVVAVESCLSVNVLPNGDHYEWQLQGTATCRTSPTNVEKPLLLCNKLALNWAGVQIGQNKSQRLVLRNDSDVDYVRLSLSVAGDHSNFQIQNDYLLTSINTNKFEASIKPQGELPVHVSFNPSYFASVHGSLILRTINSNTKFVIPLSGYGGSSNIDINGAKKVNGHFWIDMGDVYLGKTTVVDLMLRNSGNRAAFVSMKCFSDVTAKLEYPFSHVNITPNNFVVAEKMSCQVKLVYQPLKEHALRSQQEGSCTVAHLVIYSGDEVLRKEYKRNKSTTQQAINRTNVLNTIFANEMVEQEQVSYNTVGDWDSFFTNNVSRTVLAMVSTGVNKTDAIKSQDVAKEGESIQVTPVRNALESNSIPVGSGGFWSVYPEQIVLHSNEESTTKLQIANHSDVLLPFEFIWPAQTLVITPCKDKIPPRSQILVRINAKPSFLSRKEELPWRGSIYIQCDGEQKCVNVQIRHNEDEDGSVKLSSHTPQLVPGVNKSHDHTSPLSAAHINIHPHVLEYQNTQVNMVAEMCFTITNKSDVPCRWFLSSIAPPYFKCTTSKGDITRTNYPAFRFAKHSGKLNAKQCYKLPVSFLPRNDGMYSQFWDFETSYDANQTPFKFRLELIGKGSTLEMENSTLETSRKQVGTAKPILMTQKREHKMDDGVVVEKKVKQRSGHVFIKDDVLQFPTTTVGDKSEMKFRLCNDSQEVQKVRISSCRSPFSVVSKHMKLSIRPKSYIRVPVFYSPTSKDNMSSEGLLILTPENCENLCVKLCGSSM